MNLQVLYQWFEELRACWQLKNLALFSLGVVLAENSQQMTIARKIALMYPAWNGGYGASYQTLEQFMVEWTRWVLTCLNAKR